MPKEINFHTEDLNFAIADPLLKSKWISQTIDKENKAYGCLNFIFCSDEYLHRINLEYLSHDTYTDIITFDYSEADILSGDIFISIERVKENSGKLAIPFEDELDRVIIHGVLHLSGYTDKSAEEQGIMRQKEDYYLNLRSSN